MDYLSLTTIQKTAVPNNYGRNQESKKVILLIKQ